MKGSKMKGGPGSRGGRVVGMTKGGNAIYAKKGFQPPKGVREKTDHTTAVGSFHGKPAHVPDHVHKEIMSLAVKAQTHDMKKGWDHKDNQAAREAESKMWKMREEHKYPRYS